MRIRKHQILILLLFSINIPFVSGQHFSGLDRSPMDMAYFPDNFAHDRKPGEEAIIRVTYSRPQKKNRELFGNLVPYGEVWRTGANEATEIRLYRPIVVKGKTIDPGIYSLFSIPDEDEWTIIFNRNLDYWGAYSYQPDQDVARINVKSSQIDQNVEAFTIQFEPDGDQKGKMLLAWGDTLVTMPFEYK